MLAVPKEALCLVGIILWDFRHSPVVTRETYFVYVMCTNEMCVDIVDIFTYFMKLPI